MKLSPDSSNYDAEYLLHYFMSDWGQKAILESAIQTGVPHTNLGILRTYKVPVPPTKAEQEAIAEALSDADALIESLEQLVAKKRHIKQGAMQELLTGKRRLPGFEHQFGLVRTEIGMVPEDWDVIRLGDLGESLIGLTYKPTDVRSDGILVLRSSNVRDGGLLFEDNVYVETAVPQRIMVKQGDILICVRNGSRDLIGKCARIDSRAAGITFGAFMAVFRSTFNSFIYHLFQSSIIKRQIHEHLGATINQITNKSLNSFMIPFPPNSTEREAIGAVLSDMDAEVSALEAKLAKARAIKQGMMQELLTGRIRLV
jgi:type I restriction enzyme S subunit